MIDFHIHYELYYPGFFACLVMFCLGATVNDFTFLVNINIR